MGYFVTQAQHGLSAGGLTGIGVITKDDVEENRLVRDVCSKVATLGSWFRSRNVSCETTSAPFYDAPSKANTSRSPSAAGPSPSLVRSPALASLARLTG